MGSSAEIEVTFARTAYQPCGELDGQRVVQIPALLETARWLDRVSNAGSTLQRETEHAVIALRQKEIIMKEFA